MAKCRLAKTDNLGDALTIGVFKSRIWQTHCSCSFYCHYLIDSCIYYWTYQYCKRYHW